MKKIIFTTIALLSLNFSFSQTVNGFPLNEIPSEYIELVGASKMLKIHQVELYVDYGQISKVSEQKNGWVIGEDGKKMSFNGMMGAINLLSENGWEYVNNYSITAGNTNVYRYLMKKKDN
jgi:hypothetical protein